MVISTAVHPHEKRSGLQFCLAARDEHGTGAVGTNKVDVAISVEVSVGQTLTILMKVDP